MNRKDICCPEFDPKTLDNKTHHWKDKLFIEADVRQLFHIPLNMGQVVTKVWKIIADAKAAPADKDYLMLAYDPSPWKSELYFAVTKNIPGAKNVKLSGEYYSKVFDGPYQDVPKWMNQMEDWAKKNKKVIKKHYFHFAYCPKCSKKYGHNYCVSFVEIE
jgi:hypothetical protein